MKDFLKRISDTIAEYGMLKDREKVLAAVSGGADSVCLLLALKELGYPVSAVHVEHGIRGQESEEDCAFVQSLCGREGIPLTVRHIDAPALAAENGRSLEEAARDERYRILLETAKKEGIRSIAAAHHRGDQAETVLWNLIRGSSLDGLCGILPVREMTDAAGQAGPGEAVRIIRPLLETDRSEIERWLNDRGQTWRTDRSNLDASITRNAIRLEILPRMEKLNAGAVRHIAQAAGDLARIGEHLDEMTGRAFEEAVYSRQRGTVQEICVRLDSLNIRPELIRRRLLHRAVGEAQGGLRDITREHVESVMRLCAMDNGKRITLPGGLEAFREEGILVLQTRGRQDSLPGMAAAGRSALSDITQEIRIDTDGEYRLLGGPAVNVRFGIWEGGEVSKKRYTKTLAYDTMIPYITLRTRRKGDWIVVNSQGGRRKLKDYLIDEKVPRDRRDEILLIAQGNHVLWVIGYRISEAAKVTEGAHFAEITVTSEAVHRAAERLTGETYERDNESSDSGR